MVQSTLNSLIAEICHTNKLDANLIDKIQIEIVIQDTIRSDISVHCCINIHTVKNINPRTKDGSWWEYVWGTLRKIPCRQQPLSVTLCRKLSSMFLFRCSHQTGDHFIDYLHYFSAKKTISPSNLCSFQPLLLDQRWTNIYLIFVASLVRLMFSEIPVPSYTPYRFTV